MYLVQAGQVLSLSVSFVPNFGTLAMLHIHMYHESYLYDSICLYAIVTL